MSASLPLPHCLADRPAAAVSRRRPAVPDVWRPAWSRGRSFGFWAGLNLAVLLVYLALGCAVGQFFAAFGLFPAPIWLPAGLAATAAMLGGWRLLPGVFAGSCLVNGIVFGSDPALAAVISLGNALGPLAGVALTRRFRPASGLFTRFQGVAAFLAGAVLLHAAVTATVGTFGLWLLQGVPVAGLPAQWSAWLLCDAGGTFYFAPSLLLWLQVERVPPGAGLRLPLRDGAVWLGTALLAALLFSQKLPAGALAGLPAAQLVFLLAVPLSWVALRISLRAAYTLLTLVCVIASAGTVSGFGPFQGGGTGNPMQSVGILIVLCAMNILTLLALVSERREAEAGLAEANRMLECRVAERTEALRHQAETDALTGIANRGSFLDRAAAALRQARVAGQACSLIAFDLDHFKAINDSAGHAAGDAVLRLATERCGAWLRQDSVFGRLGGEEFAILLPGAGLADAAAVAERLRVALATIVLPPGAGGVARAGGGRQEGGQGRLSASFGIAAALPGEAGLDPLLRRADLLLYAAKAAGRDQVRLDG